MVEVPAMLYPFMLIAAITSVNVELPRSEEVTPIEVVRVPEYWGFDE
jgi:hypothetical protein